MVTLEENQYVREGRIHARLDIAHTYNDKHMIELAGHEFIVYPNVFSPAVFLLSDNVVETWLHLIKIIKPESILEIGSGAGYLAILAALHGANRVTATDITEEAVNNIQANSEKHNLEHRIRAVCGSVFEPFDKNDQFDVIFWDIPFCHINKPTEELNALERTVFDPGYMLCEAYLKGAREHLTDTGRAFMAFSQKLGHPAKLLELTNKYGWCLQLVPNPKQTTSNSDAIYDNNVDINMYELIKL
ncbi:unnamed protein product [Rotaria sp. Silwood2]|nr:unnamed protein product [Rotaria sp. Silwood2]CAF2837476.1 unnamed protein product [Rotaria sp. Silwood2]CAF2985882.1 unnamed protein product [Rotaria sp. Silwood2]CAF3351028.1 unnamed protein product [Rotaria sp. Silwood2]CAF4063211.1 unnamed protein product [Rotaria sp. Silwood2]